LKRSRYAGSRDGTATFQAIPEGGVFYARVNQQAVGYRKRSNEGVLMEGQNVENVMSTHPFGNSEIVCLIKEVC
jgi:hypothetical protein